MVGFMTSLGLHEAAAKLKSKVEIIKGNIFSWSCWLLAGVSFLVLLVAGRGLSELALVYEGERVGLLCSSRQ
jgi:hypothetical protein